MKIKHDFITNSSSTSYVISASVEFEINGIKKEIIKYLTDCTTIDCIKTIEGELQYSEEFKDKEIRLEYNQEVWDYVGDGWGDDENVPGDYEFSGGGWRFKGNSDELERIMNKQATLFYNNEKIEIPIDWVIETLNLENR